MRSVHGLKNADKLYKDMTLKEYSDTMFGRKCFEHGLIMAMDYWVIYLLNKHIIDNGLMKPHFKGKYGNAEKIRKAQPEVIKYLNSVISDKKIVNVYLNVEWCGGKAKKTAAATNKNVKKRAKRVVTKEERALMIEVHTEILTMGVIPSDRYCRMSLSELNEYTEFTQYLVDKLGQWLADMFAAQYLLLQGNAASASFHLNKPEVIASNELTEVALSDADFDKVENGVKPLGVSSKR